VTDQSFELACDRLSHVVDDIQFERLRWARTEGPMLAKLVALAHSALEVRPDFELTEEGSTSDIKRYVLKVHSNRIIALMLGLDQGHAVVGAAAIERSKYRLSDPTPIAADFALINESWMADALQQLFSRVHQ
jgi:hypothetical protein